jgi:methyltransferase-like protein/SAM-dependent methyltransferase
MPFPQTHIDRLAMMAYLFGLKPTSIHHARVLEIGCCDGGNLIPMALSLPGSEFTGIDLTETDITIARATASSIGLSNIEFHALDLTTLPGDLGQFDYIISHGVYSWVPSEVREKLLAVIKASLTPNGVAFVSYNILPGGHLNLMMRELLLYHTRGIEDPEEIITRSKQLLTFIDQVCGRDLPYQTFIKGELEMLFKRPDYGLFHDELEKNYHPVYFHEFVAHAARYGLQYLSETNYFEMCSEAFTGTASPVFQKVAGDPILKEQYLDFARCRRFRQTLLCHADRPVWRKIRDERFPDLHFAATARLTEIDGDAREFQGPHSSRIKTTHQGVIRILHQLIDAWPGTIAFSDLSTAGDDIPTMYDILGSLFMTGLLEIRSAPPRLTQIPSERPVASPLARFQAANGLPVTSLRHMTLNTSGETERRLIALLDGTRTRDDLFNELRPLLSTEKPDSELRTELETSLQTLGRLAVLIA